MSRSMNTWSCPACGTAAFAEQNFCRTCGTPRPTRGRAPITTQIPAVGTGPEPPFGPRQKRSMSRISLVLVALLFVIIGGFAALVVDDATGNSPSDPTPASSSIPAAAPNRGVSQLTTTTTSTTTTSTTLAAATTTSTTTSG